MDVVGFEGKHEILTPILHQVFEEKIGFHPNLSVMDLLFCVGPQSSDLLKNASFSHH